jgi:hypothetical protein
MSSRLLLRWLSAFAFTQLVEVPIYRRAFGCSLLAAFGASAITHPVVWFVIFHPRVPLGYTGKFVLAELFAWLAEAAYFGLAIRVPRALLWAFVANAASVLLALASRALFGGP